MFLYKVIFSSFAAGATSVGLLLAKPLKKFTKKTAKDSFAEYLDKNDITVDSLKTIINKNAENVPADFSESVNSLANSINYLSSLVQSTTQIAWSSAPIIIMGLGTYTAYKIFKSTSGNFSNLLSSLNPMDYWYSKGYWSSNTSLVDLTKKDLQDIIDESLSNHDNRVILQLKDQLNELETRINNCPKEVSLRLLGTTNNHGPLRKLIDNSTTNNLSALNFGFEETLKVSTDNDRKLFKNIEALKNLSKTIGKTQKKYHNIIDSKLKLVSQSIPWC